MTILTKALAILAALGAILAALFGLRAKQQGARADAAEQRAGIARADAAAGHRLAQGLADTADRHAAEQRDSDDRIKAGKRDHLEGKW